MRKTNENNASFNDLTVDTAGLQALMHAGIKTATEIGTAAGAKIYVGRRVLWNVAKIRKYKQYYSLVIEACNRANEFLASHLVKSFTESVGYRQIFKNSNSCELPCTENDFYGYKRKALHEFDLLVKSVRE